VTGVVTTVSSDEILLVPVLDTRSIPLDQLAADADTRRTTCVLVADAAEESLIPVAKFASAI
jgi:hypothetical protein